MAHRDNDFVSVMIQLIKRDTPDCNDDARLQRKGGDVVFHELGNLSLVRILQNCKMNSV
jgi:hypothetical protein